MRQTFHEYLESINTGQSGASRKRYNKMRRIFSDPEMERVGEKFRQSYQQGKPAQGGTALYGVVKKQEPIVQAWLELGIDKDPNQVVNYLKKRGIKIADEQDVRYLGIEKLKLLRDKTRANLPLSPNEQKLLRWWKDLTLRLKVVGATGKSPVDKLHPEHAYDEMVARGLSIIDVKTVELELVRQVQEQMRQGNAVVHNPDSSPDSTYKPYRDAFRRWVGDEQWFKNFKSANPEPGVQQALQHNQELPHAYITPKGRLHTAKAYL